MNRPILSHVWRKCLDHTPQMVTVAWLGDALNVPEKNVNWYVRQLVRVGALVRISGDGGGVRYQVKPDVVLPPDARGQHWADKRLSQASRGVTATPTAAPRRRVPKRAPRQIRA